MDSPEKRFLLAFLTPLGILAFMTVIIGGLGFLLLVLAEAKHELYGIPEPLAVIVALVIAGGILGGATLLARRGSDAGEGTSH